MLFTRNVKEIKDAIHKNGDIDSRSKQNLKSYLHRVNAAIMLSDTAVIEHNGVTPKWVPTPFCNPFWSDSIVFNQSSIASVIAALMLTLGVNGPLTGMVHDNVRMCQTVQGGERGNFKNY